MFERFDKPAREVVRRAAEIAESEGATLVGVEHLLTAVVDPVRDHTGRTLERLGVTAQTLRDGRDREFRSALALAGVATDRDVPGTARRTRRGRTTRFAPSAKTTLERSLAITEQTGRRRITPTELVLAAIGTEVGITPRLLNELGVDRDEIRARLLAR